MNAGREPLAERLAAALDARGAAAFVHAGPTRRPAIRYLLGAIDDAPATLAGDATDGVGHGPVRRGPAHAVAFDGTDWIVREGDGVDGGATERLATALADRHDAGATVLTPRTIPHDAAVFLDAAGFTIAATDALSQARARKTDAERDRIERANGAAAAGVERAAALLSRAQTVDGRLSVDGRPLAVGDLRRAVDRAVVDADGDPTRATLVAAGAGVNASAADTPVRPGVPVVVSLAPAGRSGYRGSLARTLVADAEGGPERRAHVAASRALRSAEALLRTDAVTVGALEADLAAEVRAFGFDDGIETAVHGVGLAGRERPIRPDEAVPAGAIVRLDVAVSTPEGAVVRLADLLRRDDRAVEVLPAPSRSLDPAAIYA